MSRTIILFTAFVLAALALTFATAASFSRPAHNKIKVENIDLKNGKTLTRVRHPRKTVSAQVQATTATTTNTPDDEQATKMIFVISNYCNATPALYLVSSSLLYANWVVPPAQIQPSFFNYKDGYMTGFEAQADKTVDPNGQLFFNGTFTYTMINGPQPGADILEAAFGLVQGEWELEIVWATAWHGMIYASEYEDIAVYDIAIGDTHFTDKPIC
jgi:hypothetical protein